MSLLFRLALLLFFRFLLLLLGGFLLWSRFLFLILLLENSHLFHLPVNSLLFSLLILLSSGLSLISQLLLSDLFLLHLVDGLNKHSLVLELVTLGCQIEVVVNIFCDLLALPILPQQPSQNSLSSHPQHLLGHSSVLSTLSLTMTLMSTLSLGLMELLHSGPRVHMDLSPHNETILKQLPNILSAVSHGHLISFIGVNPNPLLSTFQHSSSQSLLQP